YKGVFELLPTNDRRIYNKKNWEHYREIVGKHKMAPISTDSLSHFNQFSNTFSNYLLKESDRKNIYYVAGKADETINGFKVVDRFFFGKKIKYTSTENGDGSVTWSSGIPSNILRSNLYYTSVEHGNLACEEELFNGILDLVDHGDTRSPAFKDKPVRRAARSGQRKTPLIQRPESLDYYNLEKAMDRIMGIEEEVSMEEVKAAPLQVEIFNGDLKWSNYPVMIGHFMGDGVVSAEDALDGYLNGKLTERHRMGFYPGRIGEQAIMYDKHDIPTGAVIIGLGSKDELTGYRMARSVEKAMLKYALFFRDNFPGNEYRDVRTSVSTLMIGSAYGRLPREESIRSIILGVQNANKILLGFDGEATDLPPIQKVEFVDYYEDNAYECYKILKRLEEEENHLKIKVTNDIEKGYGRRKRFLRDQSRSWWQSFTTEVVEEKDDKGRKSRHLAFTTYNGLSSASKDNVRSDLQLAMYLADELSTSDVWDKESSKVIFELLLPNQYKDFVRNHRNIQWRMDSFSAQFPWEMFHDTNYGEKPTFIESGLIRQLYNEEAILQPALVTAKRALVIGDPIFDQSFLPQLPGAKAEAQSVIVKLKAKGYAVEEKIAKNPLEITKALFAREYRVLHIASHGLYDLKNNRIGIAIGGDQLLTPGTIKQLTAIPEFVFINCCYSGKVDDRMENYVRHRHKLAANVGTQLIDIGVKAVVIAGWKVNDHSARVFAEHLYDALLSGAHFGDAVTRARRACYLDNKSNNTWGAYQCYGDQFYKLSPYQSSRQDRNEQTLDIEIVLELDNIISKSESVEISKGEEKVGLAIFKKTQELVEKAESLGPLSSEIIEKEAIIYHLLGRYEAAIEKFEELFRTGEGKYLYAYIDTYYNIKSKFLARLYDKKGSKEGCPFTMEEILDSFRSHISFNDYAESLSSHGSILKRAALLAESKPDCRRYLEDSAYKYMEAGKKIGIESKNSIYHFTSFITLATLCNLGLKTPRIDINEEMGMEYDAYLDQWIKKLQYRRVDRTDLWLQLSEMQLKVTSLLTSPSDSVSSHQAMCKELLSMYHKQIEKTMNIKVLVGEYEHMLFLKHILGKFSDMKERMGCIIEIKEFIAKYLPGM
ncbi:MAG: CHAT domain-containing protein, partial [Saprospiraceae bacterium]|nr:CHAT domain-containing protein [Saprospiraceae bacterium]